MSGPLKNARHERFAQELAKGSPASTAYVAAGYAYSEPNASRLTRNEKVAARLLELKERAAVRAEITAADMARQLDEDRTFAREKGQAAAMVSASLGKAKLLGLMPERHEHTGKNGGPIEYRDLSDDEVNARIAAHEANRASRPTAH